MLLNYDLNIYHWLNRRYGDKWLLWHTDTLKKELEYEQELALDDLIWNKICAMRAILYSDLFFEYFYVFEKIIVAINNRVPNFSIFTPVSPHELVWGVFISKNIRDEKFSEEVKNYVYKIFEYNGILFPHPVVDFNNKFNKYRDVVKKINNDFDAIRDEDEITDPVEHSAFEIVRIDRILQIKKKDMFREAENNGIIYQLKFDFDLNSFLL
jgi:hypothetical protein